MISAARRPWDGNWQEMLQAERDRLGITPSDGYMGVGEIAEAWGVSKRKVQRMIQLGKVPAMKYKMYGATMGYRMRTAVVLKLKPRVMEGSLR